MSYRLVLALVCQAGLLPFPESPQHLAVLCIEIGSIAGRQTLQMFKTVILKHRSDHFNIHVNSKHGLGLFPVDLHLLLYLSVGR